LAPVTPGGRKGGSGLIDPSGDARRSSIAALDDRLERLAGYMERVRLAEYLELLQDTRRLVFVNFVSGLARGVGMAIGFSILGAIVIYVLTQTFVANLPVVGGFLAEIVRIVQTYLSR
jgi:predicted PurR-regulated permease PerM